MSNYRRWRVAGAMVFITVVTHRRRPILLSDPGRQSLRSAVVIIQSRYRFSLFATVLLPDHWHMVMQLPVGDANYAVRIKRVKEEFTRAWLGQSLPEAPTTASQHSRGERGVWQPRFWEHTILDEDDLRRCVDYIHWNPRKHGLVTRVQDYPWSSFHRFVKSGDYGIDWGGTQPSNLTEDSDWGEPQ